MIWTVRIECVSGRHLEASWIRVVEIDSASTLPDLHELIQDLAKFDRDHLFEFYAGRHDRHRSVTFDDPADDGDAFASCASSELEMIFPLPKNMKLFYHFDFGDDWRFEIRKTRKKPKQPEARKKYPRVIEAIGPNPRQYGRF